jgi:hypothetical protein
VHLPRLGVWSRLGTDSLVLADRSISGMEGSVPMMRVSRLPTIGPGPIVGGRRNGRRVPASSVVFLGCSMSIAMASIASLIGIPTTNEGKQHK